MLYNETGRLVNNDPPHIINSNKAPAVIPPGNVNFQNSYPALNVIK